MSQGGGWHAPALAPDEAPATTALRVVSIVLLLELIWLLLVASSVVFLAAHLGAGTDELTGDEVSRRMLLIAVPPLTVGIGLTLLGARQGFERRATSPQIPLPPILRLALWGAALANAGVVVSIVISLYHARTMWTLVGSALAVGLTTIAVACVKTARA